MDVPYRSLKFSISPRYYKYIHRYFQITLLKSIYLCAILSLLFVLYLCWEWLCYNLGLKVTPIIFRSIYSHFQFCTNSKHSYSFQGHSSFYFISALPWFNKRNTQNWNPYIKYSGENDSLWLVLGRDLSWKCIRGIPSLLPPTSKQGWSFSCVELSDGRGEGQKLNLSFAMKKHAMRLSCGRRNFFSITGNIQC